MPRTITSTEAQAKFGSILKWTKEHNDQVIVKLYGEPTAVLIPYEEYELLEKLKKQERSRKALAQLRALRMEIAARNPDGSSEEAYRAAGFSEEVIRETLEMDERLAKNDL
ncbi:MAG: type II toxin-antitoxin system prevent-host-death family antitoxin [Sphingomonadaceae bacterium]